MCNWFPIVAGRCTCKVCHVCFGRAGVQPRLVVGHRPLAKRTIISNLTLTTDTQELRCAY